MSSTLISSTITSKYAQGGQCVFDTNKSTKKNLSELADKFFLINFKKCIDKSGFYDIIIRFAIRQMDGLGKKENKDVSLCRGQRIFAQGAIFL